MSSSPASAAAPFETQQTFELRAATPADAAQLGALASRTFADTFGHLYPPDALDELLAQVYSVETVRSDLERPDKYTVLVFPTGDDKQPQQQPCAFATLHFGSVRAGGDPATAPSSVEIKRVYVDTPFHGRGAAQALLRHILDFVARRQLAHVWLIVYEHNVKAQRFYYKYGFHEVGAQPSLLAYTQDRDLVFELQQQQ